MVTLLIDWYDHVTRDVYGYPDLEAQRKLAAVLRMPLSPAGNAHDARREILQAAVQDHDFFLDVIDAAVRFCTRNATDRQKLNEVLATCASVWRVAQSGDGITRTVAPELMDLMSSATSPGDLASKDVAVAWANAFGRNGDPSDAWDHAIKALEHLLSPVVVPKKDKATLGDVVGVLRANNGNKWRSSLPGKNEDNAVAPLVGTLDLIWPNTVDRHGSATNRSPTVEEARTIVSITVALVQAHRETPLVYKVP